MPEFRITESGDSRITENSDSRILEKFGPTLNGISTITINSRAKYKSKFQSLSAIADRFTEAGDTRVTQADDIRVTEPFNSNSGSSSLTAFGDRVVFDSELYVKYLSNWKIGTPYVKYQNNWILPIAVYKYSINAIGIFDTGLFDTAIFDNRLSQFDNNWKRVD
tara:strand:- start:30575 stop:31066 length:492 start_codon:yes stop_codon:yes gene_type:complete